MNTADKRQEKDTFDPTLCFTFFGTWVEAIDDLATDTDKRSAAYKLFKAISNYSMYEDYEPDFTDSESLKFKPFWRMLEREIDASVKRRRSKFGNIEEREAYQKVKKACAENPDASIRAIARMTGVPRSTVANYRTRLDAEKASNGDCSCSSTDSGSFAGGCSCNSNVGHGHLDSMSNVVFQHEQFKFVDGDLPF